MLTFISQSRWEIDIEGVFLDGKKVPDSKIPARDGVDSRRTSALIDTVRPISSISHEVDIISRAIPFCVDLQTSSRTS